MIKNKEKRWDLLDGVQNGIEELKDDNKNPEIDVLLQSLKKMRDLKQSITSQEEELKLRLLVSSRERNVYLEKLRKIEEYGEQKEWKDPIGYLSQLSEILYSDYNPNEK